jgi:RNA polymerase subunit RPABC4/transcription elongation factor Spt4
MIILLSPTVSGQHATNDDIHLSPEEPVKGESTIIELFVVNDTSGPVEGVRLIKNEKIYQCRKILNYNVSENVSFEVYRTEIVFSSQGFMILKEQHLINSVWIDIRTINVSVISRDDEKDGIFGLPDWYCSIAVVFLTIIAIFLTWAYFKGRRIRKEVLHDEEKTHFRCSDCGRPLKSDDEVCPWCGVSIIGEEYVCGKCNSGVGRNDRICGTCGANLKLEIKHPVERKRSRDMGRKTPIDDSLKRKCSYCGTVLIEKEKECPVCGK